MAEQQRNSARRWIGLTALITGLVGAILLWFLAGQRYDDAVADLAPAPVGCETTLVFDRTGSYTFFVETKGRVGEIDGDCAGDDRDYDLDGDGIPRVSLTLTDDNGDEVDLDRADGPSYDRDGAAGTGVRTAEIDATGDYTLSVSSDEDELVVRVGSDPSSGVGPMRVAAGALLAAGLVGGGFGLLSSRRGDDHGPATPAAPWTPVPGARLGPPTAPPYANQPLSPPYGPRPVSRPGSGQPLPPPTLR